MKKLNYIFFFLFIGILSFGIDKKTEMKKLILKIREESPKDFIIIPQNGTEIYFNNGNIDLELLEAIDGVTQESLKYGYPKYGKKTPTEEKNELLQNLRALRNNDKTIMTVNYVKTPWGKWKSRSLAKEEGFLNYCPHEREVTTISSKVKNTNNKEITLLSDAENFLYLLNPEKFKHKGEYLDILSKTPYDVIIIDLFFRGIQLSPSDIKKLKIKPQGGKRLIIGYFSIGEAEDYREYWNKDWSKELPEWILYENENWEGNYLVKYWSPEWHKIIIDMLKQYENSGFDGVFLDTIDTYLSLEEVSNEK